MLFRQSCMRLVFLCGTMCCVLAGTDQEHRTKRAVRGEISVDGYDWVIASKRVLNGAPPVVVFNVSLTTEANNGYVSGKRLWRLGLFGSEWKDGWGTRKNEVRQVLSPKQRNQRARGGRPITFMSVEGEFEYTELGCDEFRYICFEFAKGDNPRDDFNIRFYTFQKTLIECKEVECQRFESDGTGRPHVLIDTFQWTVRAFGTINSANLVNIALNVTAVIQDRSDEIRGTNLWRIGLFGSASSVGSGERFGYVRQAITDKQVSNPAIPGHKMNFSIRSQFEIQGLGCGDYNYLCTEISKGDNPDPDFIINRVNDGRPFVSCQKFPCQDQRDHQRPAVARLDSLDWNLKITQLHYNAPSTLTIQCTVSPSASTDTIEGKGLWRLGLYFSASEDGNGDRHMYRSQILPKKYANSPLTPKLPMYFLDIETEANVVGLGCDEWQYMCVEFAKGSNPRPDFVLPLLDGLDFAVSCRRFPSCIKAPVNQENNDQTARAALLSTMNWNYYFKDLNDMADITFKVITHFADDLDIIEGFGLWRLGVFFSATMSGRGERHRYETQILPTQYADKTLDPRESMIFNRVTKTIDVSGVGCGKWRYICVEFAKGRNPSVDFELDFDNGGKTEVACQIFPCVAGASVNKGILQSTFDSIIWEWNIERSEPGEFSNLTLHLFIPVPPTSSEIHGVDLWRVGLYGSRWSNGTGDDRFGYVRQTIPADMNSPPLIPLSILEINTVTKFMVSGVGCGDYDYLCVEVAKGDNPNPDFLFNPRGDSKPVVLCQWVQCQGAVASPNYANGPQHDLPPKGQPNIPEAPRTETVRPPTSISQEKIPELIVSSVSLLIPPTAPPVISGQQNNIALDFAVNYDAANSDQIEGDNIWRVKVWGSSRKNGRGKKISQNGQVLTESQASITLTPGQPFTFRRIKYGLDMVEKSCKKVSYICAQLAVGKSSLQDRFIIRPVANKKSLLSCQRIICTNGEND